MRAAPLPQPQPAFQLSLRIRHPSMDPADISREMGMVPEHSFRAGQPRPGRADVGSASVHAESYWLAVLDPGSWAADISFFESAGLELAQKRMETAVTRSLGWALSLSGMRFLRTHAALLQRIRIEGGQVGVLVALSPAVGSFSIAPETSFAFGKLGITVEFEFTSE